MVAWLDPPFRINLRMVRKIKKAPIKKMTDAQSLSKPKNLIFIDSLAFVRANIALKINSGKSDKGFF